MATFVYKKIGTKNDYNTSEGEFSLVNGELVLDYGFSLSTALELVLETLEEVSYMGEERTWVAHHENDYFVEIHRKSN